MSVGERELRLQVWYLPSEYNVSGGKGAEAYYEGCEVFKGIEREA